MGKYLLRAIFALFYMAPTFLLILGFNTLDWLVNSAWIDPWNMGLFFVPRWIAYFGFGILPLAVGAFLWGCIIGAAYLELRK